MGKEKKEKKRKEGWRPTTMRRVLQGNTSYFERTRFGKDEQLLPGEVEKGLGGVGVWAGWEHRKDWSMWRVFAKRKEMG